jgi:hypothetical protein
MALHLSQVPFRWCSFDSSSNNCSCSPPCKEIMTENGISDTCGYSPVHYILDIAQTSLQPHPEATCRHPYLACVPTSNGRVVACKPCQPSTLAGESRGFRGIMHLARMILQMLRSLAVPNQKTSCLIIVKS